MGWWGRKLYVALVMALIVLVAQVLPVAGEGQEWRYFAVTGHYVRGDFLKFFDAHGGIDVFGYPRTEQFVENGRLVQYFQRQRMELWPENPEPYRVQLMLIGDVVLGPADPPIQPDAIPLAGDSSRRYYAETGHTLSGDFKEFFDSHGGLDVFGYPTTEPRAAGAATIQHFQRARFERWADGTITLGLLGDEYIFRLGQVSADLTTPQPPPGDRASTVNIMPTTASLDGAARRSSAAGNLVFQKSLGGPIYIMNADGSGLRMVAGGGVDPSLSPDGKKVVYVSWSYPEGLYVLNLENGDKGLLYPAHEARAPVWSPDGSKIAFYVKTEGYRKSRFGKVEPDDFFNIVVLDLMTGKISNPPDQPQHSFSPSWAPDSVRLVFKGDLGLYISSAEGTRQVPNTDVRFAFPVWSPGGERIAFMYRQHDHWEIGVIDSSGDGFRLLTGSRPFTKPANNVSPAWSPDGTRIVFVSDRDGVWGIYAMNADGSDQRKLGDETVDYSWAMERLVYWGQN